MRIPALCAAILLIGTAPAFAEIPDWVRDVAALWGEGKISDSEFTGAVQYLADQGIISIDDGRVAPVRHAEAASLPYVIGPEFVKSASFGQCTVTINGLVIDTGRSHERYVLQLEAESTNPQDICVMATHLHGLRGVSDTILGGVLLHHSNHPEPTILYSQWGHFSSPAGEWTFASNPDSPRYGIEGAYNESWDELDNLELVFYGVKNAIRDDAGTIFFGKTDRTSQSIILNPGDVTVR